MKKTHFSQLICRAVSVPCIAFAAILSGCQGQGKQLGTNLPVSFAGAQLLTHNQMAYNQPNTGLEQMQAMVGNFTWKQYFWPFPGANPVTLTGVVSSEWILEGRYLKFEYRYLNENADIEQGFVFIGHDWMRKSYTFYEIFSTMTSPIQGRGHWNEKDETFTFTIIFDNPLNEKPDTLIRTMKKDKDGMWTWNVWRDDLDGARVRYQETILTPTTKEEMEKSLNETQPQAVEPMPQQQPESPGQEDGPK